jgi:hypothetical protein
VTFEQFLNWLSEPSGIAIAVGALLSAVMEYWPAYQHLAAKTKRLLFAALCLAIPVIVAVVKTQLGYADGTWEGTYWDAVVAGFMAFGGGQGLHAVRYMGKSR